MSLLAAAATGIELAAGSADGWTFTVEPTAVTVSPR